MRVGARPIIAVMVLAIALTGCAPSAVSSSDTSALVTGSVREFLESAGAGDRRLVESSDMSAGDLRDEVFGTQQKVSVVSAGPAQVTLEPYEGEQASPGMRRFDARMPAVIRRDDGEVATVTIDAFGTVVDRDRVFVDFAYVNDSSGSWTDDKQ